MTILTRERFFTASLHVHLGDARQAKAGLLRRDGDRFIATYDPERASLGTAVVLARVILSSEGITVTEVILEGHDPDLTALFHAASKLLLDVEIITGPRITEPAVRVLSQDPTQATYFIPEGWDLSDALERLPAAKDLDEFFNLLADAGLQVETRTLPSGDLGGYKVALPDDGTPIWFSPMLTSS